jgi:hypothetical protein
MSLTLGIIIGGVVVAIIAAIVVVSWMNKNARPF